VRASSNNYISGVAKLQLFKPLHPALWEFRKIIYLFFIFYFYCKVQKYRKMVLW